jgi:hypothetical protein
MTTLEDFRRAAAAFGEARLAAALAQITRPTPPAEQLAACERAAGLATADTTGPEKETAR